MPPDKGNGRLFLVTDEMRLDRSDAELVSGFLRQEDWASAAIWDRFYPQVRRLLCRTFGPGHDVEDLVQEVFLRLYRKLPALRDASSLPGFVVTITTRVSQTELRTRWLKRWLALFDDGAVPECPSTDPDMDAREALSRFYRILDRLTPKHRAAFVLRHIEGMELVDVAAAVGVSLATIKRWLPRIARRVYAQAERDPMLSPYISLDGSLVVVHG